MEKSSILSTFFHRPISKRYLAPQEEEDVQEGGEGASSEASKVDKFPIPTELIP